MPIYRLRIEDDADSGIVRGLAERIEVGIEEAQVGTARLPDVGCTVLDFLVFCRLAQKKNMIPDDWNWGEFLEVAPQLLRHSFDKGDAKEKWGRENVFALGSLRQMAMIVYGRQAGDNSGATPGDLLGKEWEWQKPTYEEGVQWSGFTAATGNPPKTSVRVESARVLELNEDLFGDVGGFDAWDRMATRLKEFDAEILEQLQSFTGTNFPSFGLDSLF